MIISIPKEQKSGETRVAATPETVKKYIDAGLPVKIEQGAGEAAGFTDEEYKNAGAVIAESVEDTYRHAGIILRIWAPEADQYQYFRQGMIIIANFQARTEQDAIKAMAPTGITALALDLIPRISRAQSMDILSSQSNLAGYAAVIKGVNELNKAVPLMMTAAGTVPPAKVLVLGAGVAGLQAIATAKRLGAQVFASDVRPQVKEQVESLGGKFIDVENSENFEASGGYAKETSEDYKRRQAEAVAEQLKKTDIAVTTALIPGKPAPKLITMEMIKSMPKGSVIIDMAAESGGNAEGSVNNETVVIGGTKIIGNSNLAADIPFSASSLFARNIYNFLMPMYDKEQKNVALNFDDEIIKATCVIKNGEIL